jgi:carbamoyl-phosphate synthase large subunit
VSNRDKRAVIFPAKRLADLGFHLVATGGTAQVLRRAGVDVDIVEKVSSTSGNPTGGGHELNVMDKIGSGEVEFVFNTPLGRGARTDGYFIRTASVEAGVPCVTTMSGMAAAVQAIEELIGGGLTVRPLQDFLAVMAGNTR